MANLDLHVTSVDVGGKLWHTIRFADGSWQSFFGNVKAQVPDNDPGSFYEDVSCAGGFGVLHVCCITTGDERMRHIIRFADGSWQRSFEDADSRESSVTGAFFGVACAVV